MKSIRLNKNIRAEIISNIEQAYTLKNPKPLYRSAAAYLKEKVETLYRKQANPLFEKAVKTGLLGYIRKTSSIYVVDDGGGYHSIAFFDKAGNKEKLVKLNPNSSVYLDLRNIPEDNTEITELVADYRQYRKDIRSKKQAYSEWEKHRNNYMADVRNLLEGVNTTKQLLEVWPEVSKYIPSALLDPSSINLPSVSIALLNKHI